MPPKWNTKEKLPLWAWEHWHSCTFPYGHIRTLKKTTLAVRYSRGALLLHHAALGLVPLYSTISTTRKETKEKQKEAQKKYQFLSIASPQTLSFHQGTTSPSFLPICSRCSFISKLSYTGQWILGTGLYTQRCTFSWSPFNPWTIPV